MYVVEPLGQFLNLSVILCLKVWIFVSVKRKFQCCLFIQLYESSADVQSSLLLINEWQVCKVVNCFLEWLQVTEEDIRELFSLNPANPCGGVKEVRLLRERGSLKPRVGFLSWNMMHVLKNEACKGLLACMQVFVAFYDHYPHTPNLFWKTQLLLLLVFVR